MLQEICDRLYPWLPTRTEEEISFEHDTFLEWLFYIIVNNVRHIIHYEKSRNSETFLDKIINLWINFFLLFIISSVVLVITILFVNDSSIQAKFIFQMGLILLFGSISWTSYVFISQEFKTLVRSKILKEIQGKNRPSFEEFLNQLLNGRVYVWGRRIFRIYLRDLINSVLIVVAAFFIFNYSFQFQFSPIPLEAIIQFFIVLVPLCLLLLIAFVICSIIVTEFLVLIFLAAVVLLIPIEIQPLVEMGGTGAYGSMIIHGLYTSGFAIGILPLLGLSNQIDLNKFYTWLSNSRIEYQSVIDYPMILKDYTGDSLHKVTMMSFMKYNQWIVIFVIFVIISFLVIFILHRRIQSWKTDEMSRLEGMLSYVDLNSPENFVNRDRNHYLLLLYKQAQNMHEWPVKGFFLLDVLITFALLFIPTLF